MANSLKEAMARHRAAAEALDQALRACLGDLRHQGEAGAAAARAIAVAPRPAAQTGRFRVIDGGRRAS